MAQLNWEKADGTTGSCQVYATEEECPAPNLKVTGGFVKLGTVDDTLASPIRVHRDSDNADYAVLTSAVPTGSLELKFRDFYAPVTEFTVPAGVTVIFIKNWEESMFRYIGVTSGKSYDLTYIFDSGSTNIVLSNTTNKVWAAGEKKTSPDPVILSWGPDINIHTPDITDY